MLIAKLCSDLVDLYRWLLYLQHKHKLYEHLNCNRILSISRVPIFLENHQSFLLCFVFLSKEKKPNLFQVL